MCNLGLGYNQNELNNVEQINLPIIELNRKLKTLNNLSEIDKSTIIDAYKKANTILRNSNQIVRKYNYDNTVRLAKRISNSIKNHYKDDFNKYDHIFTGVLSFMINLHDFTLAYDFASNPRTQDANSIMRDIALNDIINRHYANINNHNNRPRSNLRMNNNNPNDTDRTVKDILRILNRRENNQQVDNIANNRNDALNNNQNRQQNNQVRNVVFPFININNNQINNIPNRFRRENNIQRNNNQDNDNRRNVQNNHPVMLYDNRMRNNNQEVNVQENNNQLNRLLFHNVINNAQNNQNINQFRRRNNIQRNNNLHNFRDLLNNHNNRGIFVRYGQ